MKTFVNFLRSIFVFAGIAIFTIGLSAPLNKPFGAATGFTEYQLFELLNLSGYQLLIYIIIIVLGFFFSEVSNNKKLKLVTLGLNLVNIIFVVSALFKFNDSFFVEGKLPENADLAYGYFLLIAYIALS